MTNPEKGTWKLFQMFPPDRTNKVIGQIDAVDDCDGDILFDYMTDRDLVEDWDEYDTDGDRESVAIMHKTGLKPDFCWEFSPEVATTNPTGEQA
jgi:hypothetical protein